ncbi:hypothetical protein [Ruegeria arenilitoris]|uniref:hypothetical protein n=1 Tax=Ruegeria arenilitoris TaxID=1173585 RepID=UPI00147A658F|nr:hypothetical protein [Ruegeria arenilitoris]
MKLKLVAGISLILIVAACGQKQTYPISGCDANATYPVTCKELGEENKLTKSTAQDLNALPSGA